MCATDAELSGIIATGLAKPRNARWQSMQALGEAIAIWLLKQGVFEDVAGGSVEAKWVLRRSDPGQRHSRPSLTTAPGITRPGVGTSTERRIAAEAPTSVVPVVTGAGQLARRRLILPGAVALGLLLAIFALWPTKRGAPEPKADPLPSGPVAPAAALPEVPPPPKVVPRVPDSAPAPSADPVEAKRSKARPRAPASGQHAREPAKPRSGLDLMTPY
jgi:hypothetical protein